MKTRILQAAVIAVSALAFTGIAQAGVAIDNNVFGIAQYDEFSKANNGKRDTGTTERVQDISPAAGAMSDRLHEKNDRYNVSG